MGNMTDIRELLNGFYSYIPFDICSTEEYHKNKFNRLQETYDVYQHQLDQLDFVNLCMQLGRIYTNLGYVELAFERYYEAYEQVRHNDSNEMLAVIYSYIASSFLRLGQSGEALKYYHKERTYYYNLYSESEDILERLLMVHINLGITYCALHNYEMAQNHLKIMDERRFFELGYKYRIMIIILRLKTAYGFLEQEQISYYTKQLLHEEKLSEYKQCFYEIYDIFKMQICLNNISAANYFLKVLKDISDELEIDHYKHVVLNAKVQYYQTINDRSQYVKALKDLISNSNDYKNEIKELKQVRMLQRNEIYRIEQENKQLYKTLELLKTRSELDELTKLPNRYYLSSYVKKRFAEAITKAIPIGIDLIDVDFFKTYNDNFGHLKGDECLTNIAKTLHCIAHKHTVIRYGGDEFIILFFDQTVSEIKKTIEEIQNSIYGLNIAQVSGLPFDRVSLSHGVYYKIPSCDSTFEDFLNSADVALNSGKKKSRNSVYFDISDVQSTVEYKGRSEICDTR